MTAETSSEERRRHERHPCACRVSYRGLAGDAGQWWDGVSVDIGCGGLLVTCARSFGVGEVLKVRLLPGGGDTALLLIAQVARVDPLPDGTWRMGCQVVPLLRADEVGRVRRKAGETPDAGDSATP